MNRQDLINVVADKVKYLRKQDVKLVILETLNALEDALKTGERITLSGFGTWATKLSPKRIARNPRTGETVEVGPRKHIKWISAGKLKEFLNPKED